MLLVLVSQAMYYYHTVETGTMYKQSGTANCHLSLSMKLTWKLFPLLQLRRLHSLAHSLLKNRGPTTAESRALYGTLVLP
jgi:hypothetical protein